MSAASLVSTPRARLAVERVQAVLDGRCPDRIPFCDSYWPEFRTRYLRERGLPPGTSLATHFDHDFQEMAPTMGPWPSDRADLGADREGHRLQRDDFGLVTRTCPGPTTMSQQIDCKIKTPADLDRFPFEDAAAEERFSGLRQALRQVCSRVCPVLKSGGPFSRSWRLRGLQQFLLDLVADPPFAAEMVRRVTDHLIAVTLAAARSLGFPRVLVHIADDFAATRGPLLSPKVYEEILLPNLKRMVQAFHSEGFRVSYESEGNVAPMLDLLDESGVDGLVNMEPRAGMFLERIRARFGNRFFVWGNVCNVNVLPSGDPVAIRAEVRRVLTAAHDGRYMGLSAHSIGPDVSSDAYDLFWSLMNQFGRYPMDLDGLAKADHGV